MPRRRIILTLLLAGTLAVDLVAALLLELNIAGSQPREQLYSGAVCAQVALASIWVVGARGASLARISTVAVAPLLGAWLLSSAWLHEYSDDEYFGPPATFEIAFWILGLMVAAILALGFLGRAARHGLLRHGRLQFGIRHLLALITLAALCFVVWRNVSVGRRGDILEIALIPLILALAPYIVLRLTLIERRWPRLLAISAAAGAWLAITWGLPALGNEGSFFSGQLAMLIVGCSVLRIAGLRRREGRLVFVHPPSAPTGAIVVPATTGVLATSPSEVTA